jgi:hypothetical protein
MLKDDLKGSWGTVNIEEAVKEACKEKTLSDALSWTAIWSQSI